MFNITLDRSQDVIYFLGIAWQAQVLVIWVSAVIGFVANIIVNRNAYYAAFKEKRLREIATEAFNKAEKIAALTPISSDDKLLEYVKYGIKAYQMAFRRKPSAAEIKFLKDRATAMAEADKLARIKNNASKAAVPTAEFMSIVPVSVSLATEKVKAKSAKKRLHPKKSPDRKTK